MSDIAEAIELLRKQGRPDGESAYPEINVFLEAVRGVIRARKPSVEQEAADKWNKYLAKCRAAGIDEPDELLLAKISRLNEKFSLSKPKEIDTTPVMQACPHCSQELPVGPNIRFWTPEELRSHADVLESNKTKQVVNA